MFKFDMTTADNFATFRDDDSGYYVFVDSFDNKQFNVRFGTLDESRPLGIVIAESDDILNAKLRELLAKPIEKNASAA